MNKTIGLYIGRFQPFHNGHKSIVDKMIEDNEHNLILIGVGPSKSVKDNPFSYSKRLGFISDTYKNSIGLDILPLIDNIFDQKWIQQILGIGLIQKSDYIKLYCGDKGEDSAIKVIEQYINLFERKNIEIIEIDRNITPVSGTQIRHEIKKVGVDNIKNLVPAEVHKQLKKNG